MKPKNSKDRRNSFIKFILLFLATVTIIICAIFFTFKVPTEENKILKEQSIAIEEEIKFQKVFSSDLIKARKLIDSLDVPGTNTKFLNEVIGQDLAKIQKTIPGKESKYNHDMYFKIVNMMVETQNMKGKLSEFKDAENTIAEYKEALDKSNENFKQLERDLMLARNR